MILSKLMKLKKISIKMNKINKNLQALINLNQECKIFNLI